MSGPGALARGSDGPSATRGHHTRLILALREAVQQHAHHTCCRAQRGLRSLGSGMPPRGRQKLPRIWARPGRHVRIAGGLRGRRRRRGQGASTWTAAVIDRQPVLRCPRCGAVSLTAGVHLIPVEMGADVKKLRRKGVRSGPKIRSWPVVTRRRPGHSRRAQTRQRFRGSSFFCNARGARGGCELCAPAQRTRGLIESTRLPSPAQDLTVAVQLARTSSSRLGGAFRRVRPVPGHCAGD